MQKDELRVLIVDDDKALGKALSQAVIAAGYKAVHVTQPDEALSALKLHPIHVIVIDCMLPKMNGRDLAKKIKQEFTENIPIILMSGIFKDKNFTRDAIQSTGAHSFLTKPFELADFISEINSLLAEMIDTPVSPLAMLLTNSEVSHKERIRAINETQEVHGFDLPLIFSFLMHQRIKGFLNIISADGEVTGVGFEKGNIIQVNQNDAKSYFGVLLVEHGFVTQAELDEVTQKGGNKKIGELLVDANAISPHAVNIVMAEQQGIRLSLTVNNTSVKVNFLESDDLRQNACTDRSAFTDLMNEWLLSKISLEWLKSFYMPWLRFNLKKGPEYSPDHRCFQIPVVQRVPEFVHELMERSTLEEAISKRKEPEDFVYRALHALVTSRVIHFVESVKKTDFSTDSVRLKKLLNTLDKQNHFQRLGVSAKAKDVEIKRAYHELAKVLHPDKIPVEAPEELRNLAKLTFERIVKAYEVLSNAEAKANYLLELEKGQAENILLSEQMIEQGRSLISKGDISKARELIEEAIKLVPPTSEGKLILMWVKLKRPGIEQELAALNEIREQLSSIPPEDRHGATFYFVKGLLLKMTGDSDGARKNLEHAVSLSHDFIDARRELHALENNQNKPVDLLTGDLKDVVGMLFKKKK